MKLTQIKETCLYVNDLEKTRQFYEGQLGLPAFSQVENSHVFFRAGTSVLLCFIAASTREQDSLPPHFAEGQMHIAFEVATREDYNNWKKQLQRFNIPIEHEQEWKNGRFKSFYFRDPDNHLLEIVEKGMWDG